MRQLFIPVLALIILSGCASPRNSQITNTTNQNISICDKTVRYTIEKVKMIEGGNEIKTHAEITVDPLSKNINLNGDDPESGKKSFDAQIESIECRLNKDLTDGQSTYKGYIKQNDGRKTRSTMTIEFKGNQLVISGTTDNRPSNVYMIIDHWEIVEN